RLERHRADAEPDPLAVHFAPDDRKQRRDEQEDTEQRRGPLEAGQRGEIAWDEDRPREGAGRDERPRELLHEEVRREPLDEHEADRGERGGDRQEQLVAADAARREEDVERERDDDEGHGDDQLLRTEAGDLGRGDRDRAGDPERGHPEEQTQLRPAARDRDHPAPFSSRSPMRPSARTAPSATRSAASARWSTPNARSRKR